MKLSKLALASLMCVCCVGTGVLSSVVLSHLTVSRMPAAPQIITAQANTSDRVDGYLTCTGYVDTNLEALYVLDSTTGILSAGVLSKNSKSASFQARYQGNVNLDLEKAITFMSKAGNSGSSKRSSSSSSRNKKKRDANSELQQQVAMAMPSEPKYIMTCGVHDMPGTGQTRPGASALYVTEVNTGLTLVYVLPWNASAHSSNVPVSLPITYYTIDRFLVPMVTEEAVDEE
ncbi:MAG: hypothetical protein Q4C70_14380 [Planctomycetia bacterium]|nr:hypothetical protein [Planctomycetia bacterium]